MGKKNYKKKYSNKDYRGNHMNRRKNYYSSNLLEKNIIRQENPEIFHFANYSKFIYEPTQSNFYFDKIQNKNIIKPSKEDKEILAHIINEDKVIAEDDKLFVLPFFKLLMDRVSKNKQILDQRDLIIKSIINSFQNNENISIKKVMEKYNTIAESKGLKKIGLSLVHSIMRKKLFLSFKKKSIKSKKLIDCNYIRFTFFFLKIFCRCLLLGLKFIFIDESGFFLHNNNYRTWVEKDEEIYFYSKGNKKLNLLLAVSDEKIIHYKFQEENTNSNNFKRFMEEIIQKIKSENIKKYVIILDNCSCHKTIQLFNLYKSHNLKVLFNVPYLSNFNMIENVFRLIKNQTYKKLYNNIKELKSDIVGILCEDKTKDSLKKLFRETIENYIKFIDKNEKINLNI